MDGLPSSIRATKQREKDIHAFRAYCTPMRVLILLFAAVSVLLCGGCHHSPAPDGGYLTLAGPHDRAVAANNVFLHQPVYDPWVLTNTKNVGGIPFYKSNGQYGYVSYVDGTLVHVYQAGHYDNGVLHDALGGAVVPGKGKYAPQSLNLRDGTYIANGLPLFGKPIPSDNVSAPNWPALWRTSDVVIGGDAEAQQVTHANLFYLLSSTYPGSDHSIPPFGLSSNLYGGHIFWDAEVWMLPALIVQRPDYAKSIIDYRFKRLGQAKKSAQSHGFAGAEYPWESADTGAEMVGGEFARERHITADVGWAAWQYYLWTDDKTYLKSEGWPILQATAQYWVSRVTKGADGKYHIKGVLSPDETAGVVDDDAWTNAVVQANLRAAARAAKIMGQSADPRWAAIADGMYFAFDKARGIPAENDTPMTDRFAAKQADTLLLLHPLNVPFDAATQGKMLDFYTAHTIKNGPAMTASIEAVAAARLGRGQDALNLFHDSYRPFMRGPWDAFAEKRTSSRVYFCTGMGGCLQSVLYGFAGLQVVEAGQKGQGTKLAGDGEASLYADPHLPPGWGGLTVKGVRFRGKTFDLNVMPGDKVGATPK